MKFLNLFLAEWKKITGNTRLALVTLWIYPMGIGAFLVFVNLFALFDANGFERINGDTQIQWTNVMVNGWGMLNGFNLFLIVGLPVMAFLAVGIAGEYEWNTWKNIVPRSQRATLLISKLLALVSAMLVSILLMTLVLGIGWGTAALIAGQTYGPTPSGAVLREFVQSYLFEALLAAGYLLVLAGFATLAALRTRTIIGAMLISYLMAMLESLSLFLLQIVGGILGKPELGTLVRFMPSYSVRNIRMWVHEDMAIPLPGAEGVLLKPELGFSVVVLAAWIVFLIALDLYLFQTQDLTS